MDDLETRIKNLEKQNRRLTSGIILLGLIIFSSVLLGATTKKKIPDEIVAHSFRIVNDSGKNNAQIEATPDGFVGLYFRDLENKLRFGIMMTPSGKPSVVFFGDKNPRLELGVVDGSKEEEYSLQLKDRDNKTIWQVPVSNPY